MLDIELRNKARRLRSSGKTYQEILGKVSVSKSTLSRWLSDITLSPTQLEAQMRRSKDGRIQGRAKAAHVLRRRRIERETDAIKKADQIFEAHLSDPFFIFGVSLCWSQGSTKSPPFLYVDSDEHRLFFMSHWIERFLRIPVDSQGFRVYVRKDSQVGVCKTFWTRKLGLREGQIRSTVLRVSPTNKQRTDVAYRGSLRIEIGKMLPYRMIQRWQKRLAALILPQIGPHSLMDKVAAFEAVDLGSTPGGGTDKMA